MSEAGELRVHAGTLGLNKQLVEAHGGPNRMEYTRRFPADHGWRSCQGLIGGVSGLCIARSRGLTYRGGRWTLCVGEHGPRTDESGESRELRPKQTPLM